MTYITKPVTTSEWVSKLAFYTILGRETPTGEMVDTIDFIGERTKEELETYKITIQEQLLDVDSKISMF